jgi:hypothetical protein
LVSESFKLLHIHEIGKYGDHSSIAVEFLVGATLKHLKGNEAFDRQSPTGTGAPSCGSRSQWIEVADVLDAAHAQGIVQAFQVVQLPNQEREQGMVVGLKTDFLVDPQRSDPRFAELVSKIGLPQ